jgi:hypothetical protein
MSSTCDKPIFRGNRSISGGPTGHCALPKNHSDGCKFPEELPGEKETLPENCPYDNWHQGELGEESYPNPLDYSPITPHDPENQVGPDEC